MKLSERVLEGLAKMVCGDVRNFPYRTGWELTKFFKRCGFPFIHGNETRWTWTYERLAELNLGSSQSPDLPSDDLCRVISEMFDPDHFDASNEANADFKGLVSMEAFVDPQEALKDLNALFRRTGIVAYLDESGRCYLRSTGTGVTSANLSQQTRPLSQEEIEQRQKLAAYLDTASEDDFIEKVLVPRFQRLGFRRVSPTGHKDKTLEFGKDLWMKYQLPTGHWIYFCAQIKKGKIDSNNALLSDLRFLVTYVLRYFVLCAQLRCGVGRSKSVPVASYRSTDRTPRERLELWDGLRKGLRATFLSAFSARFFSRSITSG